MNKAVWRGDPLHNPPQVLGRAHLDRAWQFMPYQALKGFEERTAKACEEAAQNIETNFDERRESSFASVS